MKKKSLILTVLYITLSYNSATKGAQEENESNVSLPKAIFNSSSQTPIHEVFVLKEIPSEDLDSVLGVLDYIGAENEKDLNLDKRIEAAKSDIEEARKNFYETAELYWKMHKDKRESLHIKKEVAVEVLGKSILFLCGLKYQKNNEISKTAIKKWKITENAYKTFSYKAKEGKIDKKSLDKAYADFAKATGVKDGYLYFVEESLKYVQQGKYLPQEERSQN